MEIKKKSVISIYPQLKQYILGEIAWPSTKVPRRHDEPALACSYNKPLRIKEARQGEGGVRHASLRSRHLYGGIKRIKMTTPSAKGIWWPADATLGCTCRCIRLCWENPLHCPYRSTD